MNLKEEENLAKTFEELCLELGGTFEADRDYTCRVNDEKSLKELEKFFAELVWSNMIPEKDFYAKLNKDGENITIGLDTFYRDLPLLKYYVTKKERAEIPEKVNELGDLDRILSEFFHCHLEEEEVGDFIVCRNNVSVTPKLGWGEDTIINILKNGKSYVDKLLSVDEQRIDLLKKALDDVREGNIWKFEKLEYACGIPFAIYEKDGNELAVGFGLGADGGLVFENTDLPDAIMKLLNKECIAEEPYFLEEMEAECSEENESEY